MQNGAAARLARAASSAALLVSLLATGALAGPLHEAAAGGDLQRVNAMLKSFTQPTAPGQPALPAPEIDARDDAGKTPLLLAVEGGHEPIVAALLGAGADPNRAGSDGTSPVFAAVAGKRIGILELLGKGGADINRHGSFRHAVHTADNDLVAVTANEATPIHAAASKGDIETVIRLIALGADVNILDDSGRSTLHYAAAADPHVASILIRAGADVNLSDKAGITPLMQAVLENQPYWLTPLVAAGANVDQAEVMRGRTALHLAARSGLTDAFKILVDLGANINAKDDAGRTPLMYAVDNGDVPTVEFILESGADLARTDDAGRSAIYSAVELDRRDLIEVLLKHGADLNVHSDQVAAPLLAAKNRSMVEFLLDRGAAIEQRTTENGYQLIHAAAAAGDIDLLRFLMKRGADVNARTTKKDETPLHLASYNGEIDMVLVLLEHGANVMARTAIGATPIQYASHKEHAEIVALLQEHGAVPEPFVAH